MLLFKLTGEGPWDAVLVAGAALAVSEALRGKHREQWIRGLEVKAIREPEDGDERLSLGQV